MGIAITSRLQQQMNSCTARVEQQAFEITTLQGELESERAARMHAEDELNQKDRTPLGSDVLVSHCISTSNVGTDLTLT